MEATWRIQHHIKTYKKNYRMSIHIDVFVILRTFTSTTRTHNNAYIPTFCMQILVLHFVGNVCSWVIFIYIQKKSISLETPYCLKAKHLHWIEPANRLFSFCPLNCYSFLSFAALPRSPPQRPYTVLIFSYLWTSFLFTRTYTHTKHYSHTNDFVCIRGITIAFILYI